MVQLVEKKKYRFSGDQVLDNKLVIPWGWEKIEELGCLPVITAVMLKRDGLTESIGNNYSFLSYPTHEPTELTIWGLDDNIVEITLIAI